MVLPVSDVDRAKRFYEKLGFRLDVDFAANEELPGGTAHSAGLAGSIIFGKGVTSAQPGSIDRLVLAVYDIDAARDELLSHGVEVSEVFHDAGGGLGGGFHRRHRGARRRVRIPNAVPTPRMPRSAIPTATVGCCRRSRSGSRAGCDDGRCGSRTAPA